MHRQKNVDKNIVEPGNINFQVLLYTLFLYFLIMAINPVYSQKNIRFGINDPRNPDCPCHAQQKTADKEYAQFNKINLKKNNSLNSTGSSDKFLTHLENSLKKINAKKTRTICKMRFKLLRKFKCKKKIHSDYSVCYKW
jgi:hypothetical protein